MPYASHAEVVSVPRNLCVPIPAGVDFEDASYVTLGAIALHGFRLAEPQLGESVAVIGMGLLGLLAGSTMSRGSPLKGVAMTLAAHIAGRDANPDIAFLDFGYRDITDKAEDLAHRGVRRVFAIFVKTGHVSEWSKDDGKFVSLDHDARSTR